MDSAPYWRWMEVFPDFKQLASSWINTGEVGVLFAMQKKKNCVCFWDWVSLCNSGWSGEHFKSAGRNKQTKNNKNLRGSLSAQVTVGGGIKAVVLTEQTGQMLDPF